MRPFAREDSSHGGNAVPGSATSFRRSEYFFLISLLAINGTTCRTLNECISLCRRFPCLARAWLNLGYVGRHCGKGAEGGSPTSTNTGGNTSPLRFARGASEHFSVSIRIKSAAKSPRSENPSFGKCSDENLSRQMIRATLTEVMLPSQAQLLTKKIPGFFFNKLLIIKIILLLSPSDK